MAAVEWAGDISSQLEWCGTMEQPKPSKNQDEQLHCQGREP
jgi:hypothetical protein